NNQLAALFDNAAELVARLAADPKLVVVLVEERDYSFILTTRVLDVDVSAHFGSAPEGFAEVPAEERVRAQPLFVCARDDGVERDDVRGDEVGGGLYHVARRSLDATDDTLD